MNPADQDNLTARGAATRQRLIDAAYQELLVTGGRLEVAAVARRAKVAVGLLYRYFGSKDGLVEAVVNAFYDRYDAEAFAADMGPGLDWRHRERLRLRREIAFLYDDPMGRIVLARRLREPAAAQADAVRLAAQIDLGARNVARGQREGQLDEGIDPRLAAAAFLGAFRAVMGEALDRQERPSREALFDAVWRLGFRLLAHRDETEPTAPPAT